MRHPKGVTTQTVETYRRAVRRYLEVDDPQKPTEQTRNAIADALGIDRTSLPADDDEDEDLAATLQALLREQKDLSRRMERALKGVQA